MSKKASADLEELKRSGKGKKAEEILDALTIDPFRMKHKKLKGEAQDMYSIRLNATDRIVFEIEDSDDERYEGIVKVIRMRTHYKSILSMFVL